MGLLKKITELFRTGNPSGDVLEVFPFLRFIFPGVAGYRERKSGTETGQKFLLVSEWKTEFRRTAMSVTERHSNIDKNIPPSHRILTSYP
jgi:hypothetical protein